MRLADWVVVPSVWWENSPVVIQEAFFHGRPVIAADIGGMAEKVRDGIDGLHFHARSAEDLADRLTAALSDRDLWERLRDGIEPPTTYIDCAREHLQLYRRILDRRPSNVEPVPLGRVSTLAEERIERRM
jgi:glycosyltransferase involved in cell wall biosynthesis